MRHNGPAHLAPLAFQLLAPSVSFMPIATRSLRESCKLCRGGRRLAATRGELPPFVLQRQIKAAMHHRNHQVWCISRKQTNLDESKPCQVILRAKSGKY